MEFAVSPLFVYRGLVRPLWARRQLVLFLVNAAFVDGGEGSSVAVFRLGVLRYNHMTVGKKASQKTAVVKIRGAKKKKEGGRRLGFNVNFTHCVTACE